MAWSTAVAQAPAPDADLVDACGDDPGWMCEWVFDQTGNATLAGLVDWLVSKPLTAVVILIAAVVARLVVHRAIDRFVRHIVAMNEVEADADDQTSPAILAARTTSEAFRNIAGPSERVRQRALTLGSVLRSVSSAVIFVIAGLTILGQFEINIVPLLAGAGIAGIAIGFGAQSLVKDFLTGIFMLVEDQFGVGDVVDLGEATGTVERLGLRSTRLRDVEGTVWHVPNGEITRVGNMSQLWARSILDVEVAYDTDLEKAIEVIKDVADQVWREQREDAPILEEPEVWGVESVSGASMAIRLAVKTRPSEQWRTARLLRIRLKEEFDRQGIGVPFPQQALWVRSDPWVPGHAADGAAQDVTGGPDADADAEE